ncbi:MAG: SGNH/GDSL hydrolase family protein [Thermoanaerobaculales bacterium]|nr:SGNH/GDSL hydrolase family protein [Thermoanaerobaculales bacterium]
MGETKTIGRRVRDLVIILISTIGLGILAEVGTRVVILIGSHTWPTTKAAKFDTELRGLLALYRRHPFLNTSPNEGMSASAFGKQASFNSLGYRSPERPATKTPGTIRILCAGGSTTFDILSADDSQTWPWKMEEILRARGLEAEVFNAGFPGWTSLENLISLANRDLDIDPDIVVLYQGINDLQPASHQPFDSQYEHGHAEEAVRALGFELQPLKWYEHSLLVEKARELVVGTQDPWQRLQSFTPSDDSVTELPAAALETFERNLQSFVAVAVAGGSEVVLVTQPMRIRSGHTEADQAYLAQWILGLDPTVAPAQLERFNSVVRELTMAGPAVLADVARDVAWEESDFGDPMHFSTEGSARMARVMADIVEGVFHGTDGAAGGSPRVAGE